MGYIQMEDKDSVDPEGAPWVRDLVAAGVSDPKGLLREAGFGHARLKELLKLTSPLSPPLALLAEWDVGNGRRLIHLLAAHASTKSADEAAKAERAAAAVVRAAPGTQKHPDSSGQLPLHKLFAPARKGSLCKLDKALVKELVNTLASGWTESATTKDVNGDSPLQLLCKNGSAVAMEGALELLATAADQQLRDPESRLVISSRATSALLPLHLLCANGNISPAEFLKHVEWLLDHAPGLSAATQSDDNGMTALDIVCSRREPCCQAVARLLKEEGVAASAGKALHELLKTKHKVTGEHVKVCVLLLEADPDIIKANFADGKLPLHLLCDNFNLLSKLAEPLWARYSAHANASALVVQLDADEYSPLQYLCRVDRSPCSIALRLSLIDGILVTNPGAWAPVGGAKKTALHEACDFGTPELKIIRKLLKASGGDGRKAARVEDSEGKLPLHLAALNRNAPLEVLKELVEEFPEGCSHTDTKHLTPQHAMQQRPDCWEAIRNLLKSEGQSLQPPPPPPIVPQLSSLADDRQRGGAAQGNRITEQSQPAGPDSGSKLGDAPHLPVEEGGAPPFKRPRTAPVGEPSARSTVRAAPASFAAASLKLVDEHPRLLDGVGAGWMVAVPCSAAPRDQHGRVCTRIEWRAENGFVTTSRELARRPKEPKLDSGGLYLDDLRYEAAQLRESMRLWQNRDGLVSLSLDGNKLTSLPEELCALPGLKRLSVCRNELQSMPAGFERLASLRELYLDENRQLGSLAGASAGLQAGGESSLEDSPGAPPNLVVLSVIGCAFTDLPPKLLGTLEKLYVEHNRLPVLELDGDGVLSGSAGAGGLALTHLNAACNNLSSFPARDCARLGMLRELWLGSNMLYSLPDSAAMLTSLTVLSLPDNRFVGHLPHVVYRLAKLEVLDLTLNRISTVADDIWKLSSLRALWLSDNCLTTLPVERLVNMNSLARLGLASEYPDLVHGDGNRALGEELLHASHMFARGDKQAMRDWLKAQEQGWDELDNKRLLAQIKEQQPMVRELVELDGLDALPKVIGSLSNLSKLELSGLRECCEFPEDYLQLRELHTLTLRGVALDRAKRAGAAALQDGLPERKYEFQSLLYLTINYTALKSIPEGLCSLTSLVKLDFGHNVLEALPAGLTNLCALAELSVEDNLLKTLELGHCDDASAGTTLGAPPLCVEGLCNLRLLNVSRNYLGKASAQQIVSLPPCCRLTFEPQGVDNPPALLDAISSFADGDGCALLEFCRLNAVIGADEDVDECLEEGADGDGRDDDLPTCLLDSQQDDPITPSIDQIVREAGPIDSPLLRDKPHEKQQEVAARLLALIVAHMDKLRTPLRDFEEFELVIAVPELNSLYNQTLARLERFARFFLETRGEHLLPEKLSGSNGAVFKIANSSTGARPFAAVKERIIVRAAARSAPRTACANARCAFSGPSPAPRICTVCCGRRAARPTLPPGHLECTLSTHLPSRVPRARDGARSHRRIRVGSSSSSTTRRTGRPPKRTRRATPTTSTWQQPRMW
jgi:Leucine-rich repeat (LRR) protein/ankyrin repeat protein